MFHIQTTRPFAISQQASRTSSRVLDTCPTTCATRTWITIIPIRSNVLRNISVNDKTVRRRGCPLGGIPFFPFWLTPFEIVRRDRREPLTNDYDNVYDIRAVFVLVVRVVL